MRAIFVCFFFSICTLCTPLQLCADDFRDGVRAYSKKDFSRALALWLPLAEQDNSLAQTLVGSMYAYGEGTERDDAKAVKWFTRAAKNGSTQAQYNLGIMYEQGFGVEKDLEQARHWLLAAAEQGRKEARIRLNSLPANPSPNKVVEHPPTPAPQPEIETKTDKLASPAKISKTVDTQSASLVPAAVVEQSPMPGPVPDMETNTGELANPGEISKAADIRSASMVPRKIVEQSPLPGPAPGIENEDDDLASPPPITITLETLFANTIVEQDIESDEDELTNTQAITIRFDTLLAGKVPATTDIEQTQAPTPESGIEIKTDELSKSSEVTKAVNAQSASLAPDTIAERPPVTASDSNIDTKFDGLLGPPGINMITGKKGSSLQWLHQQDADHYTIQLAAGNEKHLIDAQFSNIQLPADLALIRSKRDGKAWYAVVYGSFDSFNDAERELKALPEDLHSWQPWIRQFDSIKQYHKR